MPHILIAFLYINLLFYHPKQNKYTNPSCNRETGSSPPVKYFYWPFQGGASFVDHLCYFCLVFVMLSCVSVYWCLVVTRLGRAELLGLVRNVYLWTCHFPVGILSQVWCLIVSIPDLCSLSYFVDFTDLYKHMRNIWKVRSMVFYFSNRLSNPFMFGIIFNRYLLFVGNFVKHTLYSVYWNQKKCCKPEQRDDNWFISIENSGKQNNKNTLRVEINKFCDG